MQSWILLILTENALHMNASECSEFERRFVKWNMAWSWTNFNGIQFVMDTSQVFVQEYATKCECEHRLQFKYMHELEYFLDGWLWMTMQIWSNINVCM